MRLTQRVAVQGANEELKRAVQMSTVSASRNLQRGNVALSTGRVFGSAKNTASEVRKP